MKLNISIKTNNSSDPLTTSVAQMEIHTAKLLQAAGVQMMAGTVKYARKPIVDRNGNTTGYNIYINL